MLTLRVHVYNKQVFCNCKCGSKRIPGSFARAICLAHREEHCTRKQDCLDHVRHGNSSHTMLMNLNHDKYICKNRVLVYLRQKRIIYIIIKTRLCFYKVVYN